MITKINGNGFLLSSLTKSSREKKSQNVISCCWFFSSFRRREWVNEKEITSFHKNWRVRSLESFYDLCVCVFQLFALAIWWLTVNEFVCVWLDYGDNQSCEFINFFFLSRKSTQTCIHIVQKSILLLEFGWMNSQKMWTLRTHVCSQLRDVVHRNVLWIFLLPLLLLLLIATNFSVIQIFLFQIKENQWNLFLVFKTTYWS